MNRRTHSFRTLYGALPDEIKRAAVSAYLKFVQNSAHPGLRSHALSPARRGQHLPGIVSITVTTNDRAIYVVQNGVNLWYWIGSHADYDTFTGRK